MSTIKEMNYLAAVDLERQTRQEHAEALVALSRARTDFLEEQRAKREGTIRWDLQPPSAPVTSEE